MKRFLFLVLMALCLGGNAYAASISTDQCQSTDFSSGAMLHSNFTPDTKYTLHCLVPEKGGTLTLSLLQSGLPVDIKVTGGRSTLRMGGNAATREVSLPVQAGQRIDVRVDPLVRGDARMGKYVLFASTDALDDPNRFLITTLFNQDTLDLYPQYAQPDLLEKPITLSPNKMVTVYIPPVGAQPHLRFTPVGAKPEQLAVGTIALSTGVFTPAPYRDGHFLIPLTDPDGMLLSLASKSLQPLRFSVAFKLKP